MSVIKTGQLMLYREIITVYSEVHMKHTNTVCAACRVIVKSGFTESNHRFSKYQRELSVRL